MYCKSSLNFSSHESEFLPLTCASPVSPGLTSCLCFCSSLYNGRYSTSNGLGPTMLMSPFSMFTSSGNSSKLVLLSTLPNFVSLSESGSKFPFSSFLSVIVLNLYSVNIFSSFPGRCCLNIIGLPSFILTSIATTSNTGDKTISAIKLNIKSNILFICLKDNRKGYTL